VVHQQENQEEDEEEKKWEVQGEFNEFLYWNLECPPTSLDRVPKWMKWIELADTVSYSNPI
jgi:hypothetical protein